MRYINKLHYLFRHINNLIYKQVTLLIPSYKQWDMLTSCITYSVISTMGYINKLDYLFRHLHDGIYKQVALLIPSYK